MLSRHTTFATILAGHLALGACSDTGAKGVTDAGLALADASANSSDARIAGDASEPLGWVDFSLGGCQSGEGSEDSPCVGESPLELRFTALAPATIETYSWDFGDGSELNMEASPVHRFASPGSYNIRLNVDGPGGSAGRTRLAAVLVIPASLGAVCDGADQCASAECACGEDVACSPSLGGGLCTLACEDEGDCGGNLCADFGAPTSDAPWRGQTCVPSCTPGEECERGTCQALRTASGDLGYGCFPPGVLAPIGASCLDAVGAADPSQCASGRCDELGSRGMCTASCEDAPCPEGSACITPSGGQPLCVATCDATACNADPGLTCREPSGDFEAPMPIVAEGYCVPQKFSE